MYFCQYSKKAFMTRNYLMIIAIIFLNACNTSQPQTLSSLENAVQEALGQTQGDFAVAFKNLDQPDEMLLINEKESFHAASTMKTPVLLEVYKQAEAGNFRLNDSLVVRNEFKSIVDSSLYALTPEDDSYSALYEQIGEKESIYNLAYYMIISSSNLATNIIIDKVGAQNVTQTLRDMGANDIQVLRGVEDTKAYQKGLSNTTTAYDLMLLFENIARHKIISDTSSQAMIDILLEQEFNDMIPAQLPAEVKVAHKTGWITGIHHDSGIVYLSDGRKYVLVLLSKNLEEEEAGVATLASISRMIYEYLQSS